ncbi:tripartite tricarboxylate transporter TctB family protein [Phaeobacter gallaeciensis]|uniref:Tripartite tricarboxylate transporter TctB family protein n=2 Tax=Roseobacteraceae TaxID=2854170 RepID=A0A366X3N0_9RHOB|nr:MULTISPECIES: tripartite tricarboxylate transporter TctB family protein [Roseobacteraceae]MBT3141293.1 tripartite tricarboxylate transporter TctB family protein [Falsiruegeria litorea]MBT8166743.1 tripartite tricarboxylate transporter TctB family protein [Falsiruegeria litorea]RBW56167.1 tripartite tricarboxylate transporter TctB family protein [Phaeobacter gallaeciensis]
MRTIKTLQDLFRRYRRPGDIVFALLFLALAIFLLTQLGEQTKMVKRTKWYAQPSLWPTVAVYGMVFFGALHYISSLLSPRIPGRWREVLFWLKSLEFVAYFLIYVFTVPLLGYLPSSVLFALFLCARIGFRSPQMFLAAAVFGVSLAVIFRAFLQVKIPSGQIYELLPDTIRTFALTYL